MIETSHERKPASGPYAEVLSQCRDLVLIFSNSQLNELFEHAGAALLDFAERAENNTIQGRFFEAMGLIQRRRPEIEHGFREQLADGFESFGNFSPPSQERDLNDPDSEGIELTLVEPDEMEESVAAENLIIKANANCFPELYALSQRLSVINNGRKLKDYEIPAGPHHLVHSFRRSIAQLDVEVRIKVILYALFEKFIIKQAKSLYDEMNSTLKAAGILPNLKPVRVRSEQGEQTPEESEPEPEPEGDGPQAQDATAGPLPPAGAAAQAAEHGQEPDSQALGAELFESILDLMSTRRGPRPGSARERARGPVGGGPSPQLVSALNQAQSHVGATSVAGLTSPDGIPDLQVDTVFIERVKQTLESERSQILDQVDPEQLSPVDADLIDLIGMLFEYMLNDPVLPNLAKALLSHLHTPYLKVALIDRRLLVDARHPARRLLDQMVEAGSLWVDENNPNRGIFPAMQRTVDRVLQEFTDDVSLFETLLEDFERAMGEQQRRADTMEHRTQEAAKGREKLQLAKRRASHQIQTLLGAHPAPEPVATFLGKTWLDYMVFVLLREKKQERSDAWKQAVEVGQELSGLFAPELSARERKERLEGVPDLRKRISEGIQRMGGTTHATLDPLFALLDAPQTWQEKTTEAPAAPPAAEQEPLPGLPPEEEGAPIGSAQAEVSEQEQEVISRLRKMKFGTWFELTPEKGPRRRIKLSWLSPLTSTCMFVDRSGMQAEIKTLRELAQEVLSGRARVIPRPKHPFIERAMVSIRKVLQGSDEGGKPTATPQG